MLTGSVGAMTKTASGIGGALSSFAGSLWGSSVTAKSEVPVEKEEEILDEAELKIKKLY